MLRIVIEGVRPFTPSAAKRTRNMVRDVMADTGFSGISFTGRSVAYAVEWCEEHGIPYVLRGTPGKGYTVTIAEKEIRELLSS